MHLPPSEKYLWLYSDSVVMEQQRLAASTDGQNKSENKNLVVSVSVGEEGDQVPLEPSRVRFIGPISPVVTPATYCVLRAGLCAGSHAHAHCLALSRHGNSQY